MLSEHNDTCFLLIEKLNDTDDSQSSLKNLLGEIVNKVGGLTGAGNPEQAKEPVVGQGTPNKSSTTRKREISAEYHNPDMYQTFEKINRLERDLIYYKDLVMNQKQQLDDLEDKSQALQRDLKSKSDQLSHLSLINESFKEKANIGMLEFLEMELKSKESQLVSRSVFYLALHSRLDEKQKEYSTKLENFQKMFRDQQQRATELEQENSELATKVNELSKLVGGSTGGADSGKREQEFEALEKELQTEKDKVKKLKDESFKDKGLLMQQEFKMSEFEQKNADLLLKVRELEGKVEEYESQVKRLEAFSSDTDVNGKVNKLFSLLHSVQHGSLKADIEQVLGLLKQWSDSVVAPKTTSSGASAEELSQLRLDNSELKKALKELKQAFVSQLPNPSEEDLGQRSEGSSMVAQQLLKKVRIFEEQNNQLKAEKKQLLEHTLQQSKVQTEHLSLLYSIALDTLL